MNSEILLSVLEEASALTASLPDEIRQVAFSKAFDALFEDRVTTTKRQRRVQSKRVPPRISIRGGARLRRIGPKQALGQLVDVGYFASSHGLPEIQRHLRDSYGHDFGSNELSISLLRLIRDGRLNRERNLSGQYEYWSATRKEQSQDTLRHGKNRRLLTDGAV